MPTISIQTLGCKVNQYESEAICEQFTSNGYDLISDGKSDIIIINSCTVTAESDRKTRQLLRRCRRDNPDALIILTGCMVQAFPEKSSLLADADLIIGNTDTHRIFEITKEYLNQKTNSYKFSRHEANEAFSPISINNFSERTRAFMKIEDGCDRYCTYCIIPFARGNVRSRGLLEIKAEAEALGSSGFSEIVLVGINLSSYGKGKSFNLCDAIDTVCEINTIKRVRLGSLEPDLITDEMLKRLSKQEKFCPQFHLSLQSGCDRTLKRMNRHYDSTFYFDLVKRIRNHFENASITTDIMVGFAGETEEEFKESLDFVKKVGFSKAHIFSYSRREGTIAAVLKNKITSSEKSKRSKMMFEVVNESEKAFLQTQIGKTVSVLFETVDNGYYVGYSPNYTKVFVKTEKDLNGQILNIYLTDLLNDGCIGRIV